MVAESYEPGARVSGVARHRALSPQAIVHLAACRPRAGDRRARANHLGLEGLSNWKATVCHWEWVVPPTPKPWLPSSAL
ncbi:hypothetical protein ABXS05_30790 [Labrys neptuniae]|uniref:Transposase n=1 Tax=Labrys neptuniae TaxID=376174 RepID=A0ABV3PWH6_9HYPH